MKIGVKFCGGCNPRYQRGDVYRQIVEKYGDKAEFLIANEGETYDGLLVLAGCINFCPDLIPFTSKTEPIHMWDLSQLDEVNQKIEKLINS